jgi:crossover junction endodeoxyribonuclease RuvC
VRVLGLDPGSLHTGYGLIERRGSALRALAHGRISCPRRQPLAERLAHLGAALAALLDLHRPDAVALEAVFHGANTRSLIVLAQARGALVAVVAARGLRLREYAPAEVKSAVTGNGRAGKDQVARMVSLLLALPPPACPPDAADALAVALCAAQRARLDELELEGANIPAR